jgi:hypothetical protein
MLEAAGFAVAARFGDLSGAPFGAASPRLVVLGRKAC